MKNKLINEVEVEAVKIVGRLKNGKIIELVMDAQTFMKWKKALGGKRR